MEFVTKFSSVEDTSSSNTVMGGEFELGLEEADGFDFDFGFNSSQFNFSIKDALDILKMTNHKNQKGISPRFEVSLIIIYVLLMISGIVTNTLVWLAVVRKAQLRTPRNLFVINLTISDFFLCLITMPFTLKTLLNSQNWDLGLVLCKLVPAIQGINIFVCSGTVLAICLDRYFTIVHSSGGTGDKNRVRITIFCIWLLAFVLTIPILLFQDIEEAKFGPILLSRTCLEHWPHPSFKALYTVGVMLIQFAIPILVLVLVHSSISRHLNANSFAKSTPKEKYKLTPNLGQKATTEIEIEGDGSTCITHLLSSAGSNGNNERSFSIDLSSHSQTHPSEQKQSSGQDQNSKIENPFNNNGNDKQSLRVIRTQVTPENKLTTTTTTSCTIGIKISDESQNDLSIVDVRRKSSTPSNLSNIECQSNLSPHTGGGSGISHHVRQDSVRRLRAAAAAQAQASGKNIGHSERKSFDQISQQNVVGGSIMAVDKRTRKELERNKRTTILLAMVTLVFAISWFPLHVFGLILDLQPDLVKPENVFNILSITHIMAMSTAITNAVLYGWFNTNLRRELIQMLSGWFPRRN